MTSSIDKNPYPNIWAFVKREFEVFDPDKTPSKLLAFQKLLDASSDAPSLTHPSEIDCSQQTLFEKSIDIQFSEKELNYLKEVYNAFDFSGDISVFDWVHYHGYLILKSIRGVKPETITNYLSVYPRRVNEVLVKSHNVSDETTLTAQQKFYFTVKKNERFMPSTEGNVKLCNSIISDLKAIKTVRSQSKRKGPNTSSQILQDQIAKMAVNIAVQEKLTHLEYMDFMYLRFKKSRELIQSYNKTKFWNELIDYVGYLEKTFESMHTTGLVMTNSFQHLNSLKKELERNKTLPSVDEKIRALVRYKRDLNHGMDGLSDQFNNDLNRVRTEGLTHQQWGFERRIKILHPKSPMDLAGMLMANSSNIGMIQSAIHVVIDQYVDNLRRAQHLVLSANVPLILNYAVIDHLIEDEPIPAEPFAAIENPTQLQVYEQLKIKIGLLRTVAEKKFPQEVCEEIYGYFENNLRRTTLFDGHEIVELQLDPKYMGIIALKKTLVTQLTELSDFVVTYRKEHPDEDLKPFIQSVFQLIFANTHTIQKILAIDTFTKVKYEPLHSSSGFFQRFIFNVPEIEGFLLVDQEINDLLTQLRGCLPIDQEVEFNDEESVSLSSSSEEITESESHEAIEEQDAIEAQDTVEEQEIIETPIASCSTDIPKPRQRIQKYAPVKPPVPRIAKVSVEKETDAVALRQLGKKNVKQRKLLKMFREMGYRCIRQKGSHRIFTNGVNITTVPNHSTLKEGTWGSIIKQVSK